MRCAVCGTTLGAFSRYQIDGHLDCRVCCSCQDQYSRLIQAPIHDDTPNIHLTRRAIDYFESHITNGTVEPELKSVLHARMDVARTHVGLDAPLKQETEETKEDTTEDGTALENQANIDEGSNLHTVKDDTQSEDGATAWSSILKTVAIAVCVVCCISSIVLASYCSNGFAPIVFLIGVVIGVLQLAVSMLLINMAEDIHAIRIKYIGR